MARKSTSSNGTVRWHAKFKENGKEVTLGYFDTKEEAVEVELRHRRLIYRDAELNGLYVKAAAIRRHMTGA